MEPVSAPRTGVFNALVFLMMNIGIVAASAGSLLAASSQSVTQTTTAVASSHGTITLGDTVTFTATVTAASGTPTGLVTFFDGATPLSTGALQTTGGKSQATFSTSLLSAAASGHSITAVYQGDSTHTGSASVPLSQAVNLRPSKLAGDFHKGNTTVTLADSGTLAPGKPDTFSSTNTASTARTGFTATLFGDGLVLVAGGTSADGPSALNSAEVYSVANGTFAFTGNLNSARTGAVAILLPNGKVLLAGGSSDDAASGALNSAELFDPVSDTFTTTTHKMTDFRFGATATLLNTGKVLLTGGENSGGVRNSAELYDPATDTFTAVGNLNAARTGASATLLATGKVLIAGGSSDGTAKGALPSAEIFDPAAAAFTPVVGTNPALAGGRWQPEAALLLSGKVLIAGGEDSGGASTSADLYDPVADSFTASAQHMSQARANGSAVALPNGMVLLAGGASGQAVDLYDADSDRFNTAGSLQQSSSGLVSTLLNNGQVLVIGLGTVPASTPDAELYAPSFSPLGTVSLTSSDTTGPLAAACVLEPSSGTASTCTATAAAATTATSPNTITGTYPADAVHSASSTGLASTSFFAQMSFSPSGPILLNGITKLLIEIQNITAAELFGIGFTENLPAGLIVATPNGLFNSCNGPATATPGSSSFSLFGGSILANAPCGVQVSVQGTTQGVKNASVTVNSSSAENHDANRSITVLGATTTTVSSSSNPSVFGQAVTFTATVSAVAPATGTPAGTVTFLDGGNQIGTGTLSGGSATFTTSALAAGNHTISASYGGDTTTTFFDTSTGNLTGNPQVVNLADTTTTITTTPNPSVIFHAVTITVTVTANAPGSGTPTGMVQVNLASPGQIGIICLITLSAGSGSCSVTPASPGPEIWQPQYNGDWNFNPSAGAGVSQMVKAMTTTAVVSSANPSVFGQPVTFTATVSPVAPGVGTPTGTVTFLDGGSPIGFGTLSGGVANFTTLALAAGNHTITTSYGGDGSFAGSTGSLTGNPQVVNKADTHTTVTSSLNPSVFGQSVTFTATVSPVAPGVGTPTGAVTFLDGGSPIGTGTLSGGMATFTTSALAGGNHTITTSYGGDGNFNGSTGSLSGNPQVVNKADTSTTVTSSANPSVFGQSVTFTATVSPVAPGAGTTTGTVTFLDGGSPIGTGTLSISGQATFTASALAVGKHTITTSYGGDGNFNGSTGSLTGNPQVVNKANTATTVTSSLNPSAIGQPVTFTATVSAVASGAGTPTGTVTFLDGGTPIGTGTLSGGSATFTTSALALGNHAITTSYGGDGNFNGNTGSLTGNPQVVARASLSITKTHQGNFSRPQSGATYTITVSNSGGAGTVPTFGTVTVTDTLPNVPDTLVPTAMSGAGWTCNLSTLTCTRSDALLPGSSYPPITLTVNVPADIVGNVTNSATVSGGTDPNSHTASDPAHIGAPVQITSMGTPNLMVTAGGQVSTQFDVESSPGEGTLSFSCKGLPAGSTCAFNPPNGNSLSQVVGMTVTSALGNAGAVPPAFGRSLRFYAALLPFSAMLLLAVSPRKKQLRGQLIAGASLFLALLALTSCGGGTFVRQGGTPAGSYTVTVNATSASTGHAGGTNVSLTVLSPGPQGH